MKILLIDNYDSFTYNLYHYLSSLKANVDVIRNDKITSKEIVKNIEIPVQGGLDPKVLLTDRDNVKKNAIKYMEIFRDHPYIFNLGHGVLPETDPNMMEYLVKIVKDY